MNETEKIEKLIEKIKQDCREIFIKHNTKIDEAHDWNHVKRVFGLCEKITKYEDGANLDELKIIALLHDVGVYRGHDNHPKFSEEEAKTILNKYSEKLIKHGVNIEKILKIIKNHSFFEKGKDYPDEMNNDEKLDYDILRDADKIDLFGSVGILRIANSKSRFRDFQEQIEQIKRQSDPNNYNLVTYGGKKIGTKYKKFSKEFLDKYYKQIFESEPRY